MQVQDLIQAAMRNANVIAPGETPTTDELNDALYALNQMLDSWSAERLLIPSVARTVLTLPANSSGTFQIGPGGADFPATPRPVKIEQAGIIVSIANTSPVEIPLRILNQQEWVDIEVKLIPSPIPTALYCDYGFPYVTIFTYPALLVGGSIALYMWQPMTAFASLSTTVQLPPGYTEALQYSLAGRLAIDYGQTLNPVLVQLAIELKDRLKASNPEIYTMQCDGYGAWRSFNVYDGDFA